MRDLLAEIKSLLDRHDGISADLKSSCELVLAEVLNNIEEHSYAGAPGHVFWVDIAIDPQSR